MNAVIFDLDGTLWDSSDEVVIAWNEVLSRATDGKLQIDKEFMQSIMGKNMEEIKGILREEIEYNGVSVVIPRRECIQTAKRHAKARAAAAAAAKKE